MGFSNKPLPNNLQFNSPLCYPDGALAVTEPHLYVYWLYKNSS